MRGWRQQCRYLRLSKQLPGFVGFTSTMNLEELGRVRRSNFGLLVPVNQPMQLSKSVENGLVFPRNKVEEAKADRVESYP